MGAHIDGFIAVAAHTVVVGATSDKKITGRKADVVLAAYNSVQAALRLLKAGTSVSIIIYVLIFIVICAKINFVIVTQ